MTGENKRPDDHKPIQSQTNQPVNNRNLNPNVNDNQRPNPRPQLNKSGAGKEKGLGLPRWLKITLIILLKTVRFLLVPALCLGALLIGLAIGYSIIGDGSAADVLKLSTWKHLYDLVFEGT